MFVEEGPRLRINVQGNKAKKGGEREKVAGGML